MGAFTVGFCVGMMVMIIIVVLINDNGPRLGI